MGSGDQPGMSCQLPIALEFRRRVPTKKEVEGKGKGQVSPQKESVCPGSFVLRLLSLSCRQDFQGKSQGRASVEHSSVLQVCPFRILVSTE